MTSFSNFILNFGFILNYSNLRILWTMKNFIFFQNLRKHTKSLSLPQTTNDIFSSFTLLNPTKILAFWQYSVTHYAGAFVQKSTVFSLYYNIYPHFTLLYFLKKYFFCTWIKNNLFMTFFMIVSWWHYGKWFIYDN